MSLQKSLNKTLADLKVLYAKVQNYHWNIKGRAFFQVHAKLEEYYDAIAAQSDEVAELLLQIGGQPFSNLKEFLENTQIEEAASRVITIDEALKEVLADFKHIETKAADLKKEADEEGNYLVSAYADELIGFYAKAIWMLDSTLA